LLFTAFLLNVSKSKENLTNCFGYLWYFHVLCFPSYFVILALTYLVSAFWLLHCYARKIKKLVTQWFLTLCTFSNTALQLSDLCFCFVFLDGKCLKEPFYLMLECLCSRNKTSMKSADVNFMDSVNHRTGAWQRKPLDRFDVSRPIFGSFMTCLAFPCTVFNII